MLEAAPAGGVLLVRQPEALVELALAVASGGTQLPGIHDQHPPAIVRREALHDDQVAAAGSGRTERGQHRPPRADLGRELPRIALIAEDGR